MKILSKRPFLAAVLLGGALTLRGADSASASATTTAPPDAENKEMAQLPPGRHALLERMTKQFNLTYDQELKIEPLLHDEESVSKPILRLTALSPDEKAAMMLKVKLAARRQIKPLLTAEQQKQMDEEIDALAKTPPKPPKGDGRKKGDTKIDVFADEEGLSKAIQAYAALSFEEKKAMILQVKQATRKQSDPQITGEQQKKLDGDIKELSAP
jgi:hypothetical protein